MMEHGCLKNLVIQERIFGRGRNYRLNPATSQEDVFQK
jgi:hypothetical protein